MSGRTFPKSCRMFSLPAYPKPEKLPSVSPLVHQATYKLPHKGPHPLAVSHTMSELLQTGRMRFGIGRDNVIYNSLRVASRLAWGCSRRYWRQAAAGTGSVCSIQTPATSPPERCQHSIVELLRSLRGRRCRRLFRFICNPASLG